MKKMLLLYLVTITILPLYSQQFKPPHLQRKGNVIQLIVEDKPFLALGGELRNSTASTAEYMRPIWSRLKEKNVNTVFAPVYWEVVEPMEGKFDFSLVDSMIYGARKENLHLVVLWFGSWKNGYSTYVPGWIKENVEKYPRVKSKNGESLGILSTFSQACVQVDAKAFKTLMQHIREVDEKYQTVIMAQVENEVGRLREPRDYSEEANKAYNEIVPAGLMQYLVTNKGKLQPEFDSIWKANGYKTSGSWEDIFGKSVLDDKNPNNFSYLPEELFSVYHYSKYIGKVASAGKEAYPIPMFVNAWPKSAVFMGIPGKYPSGGPIPHTLDIWKANAPAIDIFSPDIYAPKQGALILMEQYHRLGNPLFIPEYGHTAEGATLAFWAFGKHEAIGFSPFGIDDFSPKDDPFTKTYRTLSQVSELILQHQGKGTMMGIFVDTTAEPQTFVLNGYTITAAVADARDGFAPAPKKVATAAGIVFALGPDEFLAVGNDYALTFTSLKVDAQRPEIEVKEMEEGTFINGKWKLSRRLNGDEGTGGYDFTNSTTAGKGKLHFQKSENDEFRIVRIKFYKF